MSPPSLHVVVCIVCTTEQIDRGYYECVDRLRLKGTHLNDCRLCRSGPFAFAALHCTIFSYMGLLIADSLRQARRDWTIVQPYVRTQLYRLCYYNDENILRVVLCKMLCRLYASV